MTLAAPTTQNLFNRLLYSELLGFFPPHIRSHFYNRIDAKICKAGDVLFKRGDEGGWMAAILAGRVRLCVRSGEGKEVLLSTVERGEMFGERAFFDGSLRAGDAIAEEETTYIIITREEFFPLLMAHPQAMFNIIKILCSRINGYINMLELYALQNMPARVAQALLYLEQKFGVEIDGRKTIHANLSQTDLAQMIGSSREGVNKQIKIFVEKGYIQHIGEDIVILDREHLESLFTPVNKE